MSIGSPSNDELAAIEAELPQTAGLQEMMTALPPDLVSSQFPPGCSVPTAVVCLIDAERMLAEARYALGQAIAHDRCDEAEGNPWLACFYAMDVALRMYAAGEHLANSVVAMLEIEESQLKPFGKKGRSRQCVVGKYLARERAAHPITEAVSALHKAKEWAQAREYRDAWVHQQGPLLQGIGVVWKRRQRWKEVGKGVHRLDIGGGDAPDTTVAELITVMNGSLVAFAGATDHIVRWFHARLEERKIRRNPNAGTVDIGI